MTLFKAVVWALIFLTKLRYPPGVSIAIVLKELYYRHAQNTEDTAKSEYPYGMYSIYKVCTCSNFRGTLMGKVK